MNKPNYPYEPIGSISTLARVLGLKTQKLHRLNVNSDQASMPKSEREKIKSAVYQCEKLYITEPSSEEYKSLFNSTQGRVNSLSRLHKDQGDKLKLRLMKIKPH